MPMLIEEVAVVCLQAQRVTGLPAAVDEVGCQCRHRHRHGLGHGQDEQEPPVCARASASGGVAAFHNEVLLLHCARGAALSSITINVCVSVCGRSAYDTSRGHGDTGTVGVFQLDLAGELECMMTHSPKVLSFVLSGEAAGAVLTLALHHRRCIVTEGTTTKARCCSYSSCLPLPLPLPGLRMRTARRMSSSSSSKHSQEQQQQQQQGHYNSDDESAGFITIEKHGTITRRPPSDSLLTTDDEDDDKPSKPKPGMVEMELELELDRDSMRVEDEFLAMLELAKRPDYDSDLDLDTLIKDGEAELARAAGSSS